MKNNKGQALVEFILILPVFLMLVLSIIDFGKIFYTKYTLQNDLDLITDLYNKNKEDEYNNYVNNNHLTLQISTNNNLTTIEISKKIEIETPGLNKVLGNPYIVKEKITIEENE